MKAVSIILSLILFLMLAFGAFFFAGSTLQTQVSCIRAEASQYPDAFDSIRSIVSSGSAPRQFVADDLSDPTGYALLDVNITLTNRGIFDAEWLNIQVEPAEGDIAVYSLSGDSADVPARSAGQINLKLVTRAPQNSVRTVTIQYYVYGISRTVKITNVG